jgi:hypothetical protein
MEPQPATEGDVPHIVNLFRTCFNDDYFHSVFPPTTAGDAYLTDTFTSFIDTSQPGQIHVLKDESGSSCTLPIFFQQVDRIKQGLKAMLLWFEENGPDKTQGWLGRGWPAPYPGMSMEKLQEFLGSMDAQHGAVMGGKKHICKSKLVA